MKVKELLSRREQLRGKKTSILKSISEETAKMNAVDLAKFIESGDAGRVDGANLEKLQRRRKHLWLLGDSLDLAIVEGETKKKEKEKRILLRKADDLMKVREKLKEKHIHWLRKIHENTLEAKRIKTEEMELRAAANVDSKPVLQENFRLNLTEEFLQRRILLSPGIERIEKEVKRCREHNKKVVSQPTIGIDDMCFRNVQVRWDSKTLALVEFKILEQPAEASMRNLDKKGCLSKAEFLKEIL